MTLSTPVDRTLYLRASQLHYRVRFFSRVDLTYHALSLTMMLLVFFGAAAVMILTVITTSGGDALNAGFVLFVALPVAFLIWHLYHRAMWLAMYDRILSSPLYNREMTYRFDDEGFGMQADGASWAIDWPLVDRVIADKKGLFIFSGGLIYIVPSHAVDEAAFRAISSQVEGWMQAAKVDGRDG